LVLHDDKGVMAKSKTQRAHGAGLIPVRLARNVAARNKQQAAKHPSGLKQPEQPWWARQKNLGRR